VHRRSNLSFKYCLYRKWTDEDLSTNNSWESGSYPACQVVLVFRPSVRHNYLLWYSYIFRPTSWTNIRLDLMFVYISIYQCWQYNTTGWEPLNCQAVSCFFLTGRFIVVFARIYHFTIKWTRLIQSISSRAIYTSIRSILILSFHVGIGNKIDV
jgi:hypothetical protein